MTITGLFYKNMLGANPDLRNVFNEANQIGGAQPRALAGAVIAYATYIDDLGKLAAAVERIAHKHASLNIQPEQYPIVGKFLLEAVAAVLGDACTPEIAEAVSGTRARSDSSFIETSEHILTRSLTSGPRHTQSSLKSSSTENIRSMMLSRTGPVGGASRFRKRSPSRRRSRASTSRLKMASLSLNTYRDNTLACGCTFPSLG